MDKKYFKILVVGTTIPSALESYYRMYLDKETFQVTSFNPADLYSVRSIFQKIKFRFFSKYLFKAANNKLIKIITTSRPDAVWIFKGIEFFPETLKKIKEQKVLLVNYNPDHPFIRTFVSHGGQNVEDCIPHYDLHFCYSKDLVLKLQSDYSLKAVWLPFGFDLSEEEYALIPKDEEILKVCFIGNPDAARARIVKLISSHGIPVDVFGYRWDRYLDVKDVNIQIFDQVNGFAYWETLRKYRVQLNYFRPHNINSHNMRTFEIPACGGIQLAPASEEHSQFFKEGEEIFLFKDDSELLEKINTILSLPPDQALRLREAARERVLRNNDSYAERAKQAGETIIDYFGIKP